MVDSHDPMCDWLQTICTTATCPGLRMGDHCEHEWCQCELIAKVRADERSRKGTCWREAEGSQIPSGAVRVYREAGWFWEMPAVNTIKTVQVNVDPHATVKAADIVNALREVQP